MHQPIKRNQQGFATRAIHHGYDPQSAEGAVTPPVHLTSTFAFETAEIGGQTFAGERAGHVYSRISNPTLSLLEGRIATLEGAEAGLANSSGMGAITSLLWSFLRPGDEIITDLTLYGCTFAFFHHGLEKFGITITHIDLSDPQNLAAAMSDKTRIVYFETPANPNMRLVDITAISEVAHKTASHPEGLRVVVDNTYATPFITRPIELGADLVVHSATKYLGGHGDLIAGVVAGSAADIDLIRVTGMKDMTGAVMSPFTAFLILRGLKTLELRMERHCQSALTIARALEGHPAIKDMFFPGLESFPQRELVETQMSLPGAMIAFELKGGIDAGKKMMNHLQLIQRAVSLGDAETLIQHPASMTHSTYTEQERAHHGISEGLVRLSVGLENVEDLLVDLLASLDAVAQ